MQLCVSVRLYFYLYECHFPLSTMCHSECVGTITVPVGFTDLD